MLIHMISSADCRAFAMAISEKFRPGCLWEREQRGLKGSGFLARQSEIVLLDPAPLIRGSLPALQGDAPDTAALRGIEHVAQGQYVARPNVHGRAADVQQALPTISEDSRRSPALKLRLA
jgi:hypothetical protein